MVGFASTVQMQQSDFEKVAKQLIKRLADFDENSAAQSLKSIQESMRRRLLM